jgi:hypothetical protein
MKWALVLLISVACAAADDTWTKVRDLKTGTELRIFKKGAKQPVLAEMDEANQERIVVIVKNEQVAIPKDDIDRIDQRPKGGSRVTTQKTVKNSPPGNPSPSDQRIGGRPPGPSSSSSGGLSIGPKPDFETVYRRTAVMSKP